MNRERVKGSRSKQITIKATDSEIQELNEIAAKHKMSRSALLVKSAFRYAKLLDNNSNSRVAVAT